MEKILVTGGAGFIGTNLIKFLCLQKKYEITSLDCYTSGFKENHVEGIRYVEGFTWDIFNLFKDEKFDIIFHFGEYSRIVNSFDDINFVTNSILRGTPKVFQFAKDCGAKVIYSASSSKFGNEGKDENLSPYAWMKSKMVELLKNYSNWFDLEYEICYFFNVYGPHQIYQGKYATVVAIFERQYKNNEILTVVKPGSQTRDFTHVNDIIKGVVKTVNKNMNHEWHLRSGKNVSIIELAEKFGNWKLINQRKGERFTSEEFESDTETLLDWRPEEDLFNWIKNIKNEK